MITDAEFAAKILPDIRRQEGGLVDNPADPGGITNLGISLRFLLAEGRLDLNGDGRMDGDIDGDGDIDADDIRGLTTEDALMLMKSRFWDGHFYAALPSINIARRTFSMAVNTGPKPAALVLQRTLRACGTPVKEDGVLGPQTLLAIEAFYGKSENAQLIFSTSQKCETAGWYRGLVIRRPDLAEFEAGWLNRAYA